MSHRQQETINILSPSWDNWRPRAAREVQEQNSLAGGEDGGIVGLETQLEETPVVQDHMLLLSRTMLSTEFSEASSRGF